MKKTILLKFLMMSFVSVALFQSCKKDIKSEKIEPLTSNAAVPAELINKLKQQGTSFTVPVNQSTKGYAADAEGNPTSGRSFLFNRSAATDPAACADPDSYTDDATVSSIEVTYTCNVGYTLKVNWQISSVFELQTANPETPSQLSRGRIRLKNSGGTILYQNTTITPVSISVVGADPSDPAKTIYNFSYTTASISTSTMNSAVTIDNAWLIYTDCGGGNSRTTPYLTTNAIATTAITTPCARVDNITVVPVSPAPTYDGYIGGSDVSGSCGDAYTRPTTTFVEYRLQGNTIWNPVPMFVPGTTTLRTTGHIYYWEVMYLRTLNLGGSGTYEFRWRNTYGNPNVCSSPYIYSYITRTF